MDDLLRSGFKAIHLLVCLSPAVQLWLNLITNLLQFKSKGQNPKRIQENSVILLEAKILYLCSHIVSRLALKKKKKSWYFSGIHEYSYKRNQFLCHPWSREKTTFPLIVHTSIQISKCESYLHMEHRTTEPFPLSVHACWVPLIFWTLGPGDTMKSTSDFTQNK